MKKFLVAVAAAMIFLPSVGFAAPSDITLPAPNLKGGKVTVMQALSQRKSSREFVERELNAAQMSKILYAANGINREDGKRVNPAGMGVYCVEVYAVTKSGIYRYDPKNHKMILTAAGDYRKIAADGKDKPMKAAVNLVYVENPSAWATMETAPDRDRQIFFADVMVGEMIQSVALAAEAEGLGGYVRGGVMRDDFKRVANLSDDSRIILAQSVGYVAKEAK